MAADTGGLLLVPVSGGPGSGELQRALLLARAARARWPARPIAICAEANALSASADPGITYLPLPASPTRCTTAVNATIAARRPALVLFDSTARPAQLAAARAAGAGVIYLSSRPSARRRGFRLGALLRIDEHWSTEFDPARRLPGPLQKLALAIRPACRWRTLATLHEVADPAMLAPPLREFIAAGDYSLWCPGGGGGSLDGQPAPAAFAAAAMSAGLRALVIRADQPAGTFGVEGCVLSTGPLPNAALIALLGAARLSVLGAGSLLLQALATGSACAACALASDQPRRLHQLAAWGAVLASEASVEALAAAAHRLDTDAALRADLHAGGRALGLRNGLSEALDAMARWLD